MLLEILKRAASLNADTEFVKAKELKGKYDSLCKMVIFEDNYLRKSSNNDTPIDAEEYTVKIPYESGPKLYSMKNVEVLVAEGYAIFMHFDRPAFRPANMKQNDSRPEKVNGIVYALGEKTNKLTSYRFSGATIFGLDDSDPITIESNGICITRKNQEYEDFLCTMAAIGYIDEEDIEILQNTTISNL